MSLLWWIIGAIVLGGITVITIRGIITRNRIRQRKNELDGIKVKLDSVTGNGVSYTVFLEDGTKEQERMESSDGVESSLFEGELII